METLAARSPSLSRIALAAAAATALLRLPFVATRLWDHDSVQFALGVERFDLAAHHPHPPGYPLYIGLLKLLAACGVDPLHGMVALSVVAGAAGAAALVLLAAHLAGDGRRGAAAGLFAGALYATNPLLWFYGELPLVYAVEGGMTAVVAWAVERGPASRRRFLLACTLLALAGGLRPSTLLLLAPLLLHGIWRTGRRGRLTPGLLAAGAAVGAAVVASWLLPLLAAAGGLAAYRELSAAHFGTLLPQTSVLYGAGLPALAHNLELLVKWAAQGLLPAALTVAALALAAPRRLGSGLRLAASRAGFLVAWAGPPVLFFALFHITKAGYTLIHLPALLAAAALAAAPLLVHGSGAGFPAAGTDSGSWWVRPAAAALLAAVLGATVFLWGRDRAPGAPRWQALLRHEFNLQAITTYEKDLDQVLGALRGFPPPTTVLVAVELAGGGAAGSQGFLYPWQRHLQWYLPGYQLLYLVPDGVPDGGGGGAAFTTRGHGPFVPVGPEIELPPATERLLFVLSGPTGERLPLPPAEVVVKNGHFLVVAAPVREELRMGRFTLIPGRGESCRDRAAPRGELLVPVALGYREPQHYVDRDAGEAGEDGDHQVENPDQSRIPAELRGHAAADTAENAVRWGAVKTHGVSFRARSRGGTFSPTSLSCHTCLIRGHRQKPRNPNAGARAEPQEVSRWAQPIATQISESSSS